MATENSRDLFEARLEDAIRRSDAGSVAHIPFLTMRERRRAERLLDARGMRGAYWFWGGHYDAERACLFLLPEYLTAILSDDELEELLGRRFYYDDLGTYESALILWNSEMETVKVDQPCCTLDVLPTLLNLFGFDYDSRLYSGRDILSDTEGIAMTSNQSFALADKVYNSRYGLLYKYYVYNGGKKPKAGEIDYYITEVKNRFAMASAILNHNFYSYLDQELITKAQSWEQRKTQ